MTDAEKRLWQNLRLPPFKSYHFRRQATIGGYFCGFASHGLKLVIEVDGGQHLENSKDDARTADLIKSGYRVLRFWNNDVLQNIEGVMTQIALTLESLKSPPPQTPPHRKRGEGKEFPPPSEDGER